MDRWPLCTLLVLFMSLIGSVWPAASEMLVYDRQAILTGEAWRLVTGHLVHFSALHLAADLVVFGVGGFLIERQRRSQTGFLYLLAAAAIGGALLLCEPELARFGGLSGLAYGNVFYLALSRAHRHVPGRAMALSVLSVLLFKLLIETVQPVSVLEGFEPQPFAAVPLSHLVGVLVAGTFFITTSKENHNVPV